MIRRLEPLIFLFYGLRDLGCSAWRKKAPGRLHCHLSERKGGLLKSESNLLHGQMLVQQRECF